LGGNRLDQNTTTIITAAFTVIGTLSGAFGDVVLSNRHFLYLPALKEIFDAFMRSMFRLSKDVNDEQQSNNPQRYGKMLKNRLKTSMKRLRR
jgi:hypothetical protein